MMKRKLRVGLLIGLSLIIWLASPAAAQIRFYIGGEGAYSFTSMVSGGYNSDGGFDNTGTGKMSVFRPGAHAGIELAHLVKIDVGYLSRNKLSYTTSGYSADLPYITSIDVTALTLSAYFKLIPGSLFSPYIGGGLVSAKTTLSTTDTIVIGSLSKTLMSWHAEAGLEFEIMNMVGLQIGYRYLNLGKYDAAIAEGLTPAGNFTADLTAHEIVARVFVIF